MVASLKSVAGANLLLQSDVQISDLKTQLDEAIAAKIRVEKARRELESKIEELEGVVENASTKVSFLATMKFISILTRL